jgi:hypothetical protein
MCVFGVFIFYVLSLYAIYVHDAVEHLRIPCNSALGKPHFPSGRKLSYIYACPVNPHGILKAKKFLVNFELRHVVYTICKSC